MGSAGHLVGSGFGLKFWLVPSLPLNHFCPAWMAGHTKDLTEETLEIVQQTLDVKFPAVGPLNQIIKLSIPALKPLSLRLGDRHVTLVTSLEQKKVQNVKGRKKRAWQNHEIGPVMTSIVGCPPSSEEPPQRAQRTGPKPAIAAKMRHLVS